MMVIVYIMDNTNYFLIYIAMSSNTFQKIPVRHYPEVRTTTLSRGFKNFN